MQRLEEYLEEKSSLTCHQNKNLHNAEAEKKFWKLSKATKLLFDRKARIMYDKSLAEKKLDWRHLKECCYDARVRKVNKSLESCFVDSIYTPLKSANEENLRLIKWGNF